MEHGIEYSIPSVRKDYRDRDELLARLARMERMGLSPVVLMREDGGSWQVYDYSQDLGEWIMNDETARSERMADRIVAELEEGF